MFYDVSDEWKDIQQRFLLPEGHIEITSAITEVGAQESATASGAYEAFFSNVNRVLGLDNKSSPQAHATNELNLWALDGSRVIFPDYAMSDSEGYASDISESGSVTLTLPKVHNTPIPGVTITWGSEYEEQPPVFTVTAKNGDTVVAELTVTGNTEQVCTVDLEISNYDSVTVTVHNWCLPYRRARIEKVFLGHILTFTKKDIFSFTHEQRADVLSAELPKNSIEFSLNNIDGRWNPNKYDGIGKYLSERQKLTVRYGFDINGTIEWIKAGTFYLSEWRTPENGIEASFVARDIFEYFMNEPYRGTSYDTTLSDIVSEIFSYDWLPSDFSYYVPWEALEQSCDLEEGKEYTCAEVLQLCANAARLAMHQDRDGKLVFKHYPENDPPQPDYTIPLSLSYSHPEIVLSKPLKAVSVGFTHEDGEKGTFVLSVGNSGATQTADSPLLRGESYAETYAEWIRDNLISRKTISGEYRADPRLDVFDLVVAESKYDTFPCVAITSIKYIFNGSFRGTYEGRVLEGYF
jgi:hypothetical protein